MQITKPISQRTGRKRAAAALAAVFALTALSVLGVAGSSTPARGAAISTAITPPPSDQLTFVSDFHGFTLNKNIWDTCYPWASPSGCTNFGNAADPEQEWYQPGQIQVENGALALIAARVPTPGYDRRGQPTTYACRSGMVTTYPSLNFKYGFLQIKARIPFGKGLWSAFWLDPSNWQWPPEIDILEHWGTQFDSRATLHPVGRPEQQARLQLPDADVGWHVFTLNWTSSSLTWYFDGTRVYTTTTGVPRQAMYLISDLAVDDASPGGCNGTLYIRYIKLWQPKS